MGLFLGLDCDCGIQASRLISLGEMSEPNSRRRMEPALDDLLKHLNIREDEDQGIVLEEDIEELKAGAR